MKRSLIGEWRAILTNRKLLIPVVAIFFIPVMYAGMFLWAFWDPYSHLDRLPVAIVNHDKGAQFNGKPVQIGKDLVTNLKKDHTFDFKVMSQKEADSAIQRNKSYMIIEIPENFSKNAATLTDDQPKKMVLTYVPNQGYNFIAGQIDKNSMNEIKAAVQKNVTKSYSEAIFSKFKETAKGFNEASDGAKKVDQGTANLTNGVTQIKTNLVSLANHSRTFKEGLATTKTGSTQLLTGIKGLNTGLGDLQTGDGQLLDGVKSAKTGTDQLASGLSQVSSGLGAVNSKMNDLVKGTETETEGLNQLNQSMPALQNGAESLATGSTQLNQGIDQLETQLVAQLDEASKQQFESLLPYLQKSMTPEQLAAFQAQMESQQENMDQQIKTSFDQLKQGSSSLVTGSNQMSQTLTSQLGPSVSKLNQGMGQINQGQHQIEEAIHKLAGDATDLNSGAAKLQVGQTTLLSGSATFNEKLKEAYSGSGQLVTGTTGLDQGLSQLMSGAIQLSNGSQQLAAGSTSLAAGSQKLQTGSNDLYKNLNSAATQANGVNANQGTYNMMASPVELKSETIHNVPNYGTGFASYFLSLGLFVGSLLISVVYPFVEPAIRPKNGWAWYSSKFLTLAGIGVFQSLIAVAIILLGLGLKVQSVPLFVLTALITSFTFITLIQLFVSALGDPGRYLSIMLLILQLTTCGGTFPLELLPKVLQSIHTYLPMNYSLLAFKSVISTGDYGLMWQSLLTLLAYAVVFILLAILVFQVKFKKTFSQDAVEKAA